MFFVIPDALHDAINARLDAAIAKCPDAAKDRDHLYRQLVAAFNEHGVIPEFEIAPVEPRYEDYAPAVAECAP